MELDSTTLDDIAKELRDWKQNGEREIDMLRDALARKWRQYTRAR